MRLRHELLIARRYERPEQARGLWLSPAHRIDYSRSLWELESLGEEARAYFEARAFVPEPGDILVTPPRQGVYLDVDEEGRELFLLHAALVLRVIPFREVPMQMLGNRLLVKPDDPRQQNTQAVVVIPDLFQRRPVTGRIVERGEDVDEALVVGARILYSLYAGTDLEIDGERRVLMDAAQAMAILEDDTRVEAGA